MDTVTIHSDFRAKENLSQLPLFSPSICHEVMGLDAIMFIMLSLLMLSFKSIQIISEYAFYLRARRTFCMMIMYYVTKQTSTDLRGQK